jgi:hypothetical protein
MKNFLYVIVAILLATWFIGAFVFAVGRVVHLLLVGAAIILVLRMKRSRKRINPPE